MSGDHLHATPAEAVNAKPPLGAHILRDYIAIARPDHWTKNLFILPGVFLGKYVASTAPSAQVLPLREMWLPLIIGMAATCLISSANYTINEWLDRHFDRFHPKKRSRPSVSGRVSGGGVYLEYGLLVAAGLALSSLVNWPFSCASIFLLFMGLLYNVKPARTKDRPFLDVVSESINNPIRLCMGWFVVAPHVFPPSSILLAYWFGGAFLMAVKRFAEFRTIGDANIAGMYRQSFKTYSEHSLLASSIFHAMAASLFLGVFLIKYRIELILTFPLIAGLFAWYMRMGLDEDSAAQHPEKLIRERNFIIYVGLLVTAMAVLFIVDVPALHGLLQKTFPELDVPKIRFKL